MTTPPLQAYRYISCQPNLYGRTKDGSLLDLHDGKIEVNFNQTSIGDNILRYSRMDYTLKFDKSVTDPWTEWFKDNVDVQFKIHNVTFQIVEFSESSDRPGRVYFTARSLL